MCIYVYINLYKYSHIFRRVHKQMEKSVNLGVVENRRETTCNLLLINLYASSLLQKVCINFKKIKKDLS